MLILLIIVVVVGTGLVMFYNKMVQGRVHVQEGWSGIDVQLKRRHDLIPNLIETVKGYMKHEQEVLEKVTELRTQAIHSTNMKGRAAAEGGLTQALKSIFAVSEAYPDLKANQNFLSLQQSLATIEDEIQLARRYYNGTVRNYNISIQTFPGNIIAGAFHFKVEEFFEADEDDREVVKVKI
ncbi:MAG: LemA family protein [Candidatus Aceula meridiana]|nr:LemA family protein [Candidatus Aceula meridiana]